MTLTGPAPEPAVPPTPPGLTRMRWACGDQADAPTRHPWDKHRHPCPVCSGGATDPECTGVVYTNPGYEKPPERQPTRCFLCGADDAHLYPFGMRCDLCKDPTAPEGSAR